LKRCGLPGVESEWTAYSVDDGKITDEQHAAQEKHIYPFITFDETRAYLKRSGKALWEYVLEIELDLMPFITNVYTAMNQSIEHGSILTMFCPAD